MKDPFESPKFLLQRANDHWLEFGRLETDYLFRGNFETQTVIDPVTNRQELWLRSAEAIPNTLRGPASDAIKNLKDALESVWELHVGGSAKQIPAHRDQDHGL